jgi:photosystem II stability/assembly factor-like uncharacterized protein
MVDRIRNSLKLCGLVLGASLLVAGCAPSESTATKVAVGELATRVDQFQGAAANSKVAVMVGKSTVGVIPLDGSAPRRVVLEGMTSLIDVSACGDNSFVALDFYKKIWTSRDDGRSWSSKPTPSKWVPLALTCGPGNSYWVVGGDSTVASSSDRGANWTVHHSGEDALYNSVQFTGEQSVVVTGEFGAFLRSADKGKTWTKSVIDGEFYPYAALFVSPQVGYVTGLTGAIMHTSNGGGSWEKMENPTGLSQFTLVRVGSRVYSVGLGGSVLQLSGDRWVPVKVDGLSAPYLRGAVSISSDQFLAVGGNGTWKIIATK